MKEFDENLSVIKKQASLGFIKIFAVVLGLILWAAFSAHESRLNQINKSMSEVQNTRFTSQDGQELKDRIRRLNERVDSLYIALFPYKKEELREGKNESESRGESKSESEGK